MRDDGQDNSRVLCILHDKCSDGAMAGYIVGRKFGFDNVEFVHCNYKSPLPDITGRVVYIVDFSFKPEVLLPELHKVKSLVLLDHHKSAMADWSVPEVVEKLQEITNKNQSILVIFDMLSSGAGMTWAHLFPNVEPPMIVKHCQDYDLWLHQIPRSKEIVNGIYSTDRFAQKDLTLYHDLLTDEGLDRMAELGATILKQKHNIIMSMIKSNFHRWVQVIPGMHVPIMPIDYSFASEAGKILGELAEKRVEDEFFTHIDYMDAEQAGGIFAATYTENWDAGVRVFSLRSLKDYELAADVSEIARRFGGGGHKNAAGFSVPVQVPLKYIFSRGLIARAYIKLIMAIFGQKKPTGE